MKLFVWDFHGVLEKGNDAAVAEITNSVLQSFGHSRRMTIQEGELLSGKHWYEYFAFLLPHLNHQEHHPKSIGYLYTHPRRIHREAQCHYKIHDLRDLLKEVTEIVKQ